MSTEQATLDASTQAWLRGLLAETGNHVDEDAEVTVRLGFDGRQAFISIYTTRQRKQAHLFIEGKQLVSFLNGIAAGGSVAALDMAVERLTS